MHLDVTHAGGLALLTAARSRELYLRAVLDAGRADEGIQPLIRAEVTLLQSLTVALTQALQRDI